MSSVQVASFHLVQDGRWGITRLPHDRWQLRGADGLIWSRVLGTGRDGRVHRSFDPRRRAMFAIWRDLSALEAFMSSHPVARRWQASSASWHVALRLVHGHGRWAGCDVLAGLARAEPGEPIDTPVLVLTRASVRVRAWGAFRRAAAEVDASLAASGQDGVDGVRAVVGVGEAPVLRLGTVSVWESAAAASRAAGRSSEVWPAHAAAREAAASWFREAMFATFVPIWSSGTWPGVDPLSG